MPEVATFAEQARRPSVSERARRQLVIDELLVTPDLLPAWELPPNWPELYWDETGRLVRRSLTLKPLEIS
ncbi:MULTISPECIES: hypothetical protein [Amycolatopsis]|uniref:Uncharacterized protein n=2 Tax=Amycolatopsis TaxID=1813 RepID=A0A1I3WJV9_9PSEU|nr:hypothetical protein [Amycolatopsis sacchari]SFK06761.1 hypothetical protein SAMN05421835_11320 [Amycolatopsis sacchari]